jgi:pimeloyl-ACP methyl ester carboxylesterase
LLKEMIFEFNEFRIDTGAFELLHSGGRVPAEPQVLDLLIFLIENRHRIVTRDEIHEAVWKGRIVSDAALSSRIGAARKLIGDDGNAQCCIRTVHGRGFRFVADVRVEGEAGGVPGQTQGLASHPPTHYAKSGDTHVAYQVFGSGPVDLVLAPGFVSHIDNYWDEPGLNRWLQRLGRLARVAMFDKRGTGLSDPVTKLPDMDARMDDVRAVMDAAGFERAVIMGVSEGGSLAALFAATHPERTLGVVLYGAFARFTSWFPTPESLQQLFDYIETDWGSGHSVAHYAPSMASDPAFMHWWGKFERLGATPGAAIALMRMNNEIDISDVLATIQAPALVIHRVGDVLVNVEGGRYLAEHIPGARYLELPGDDHLPWVSDPQDRILMAIGTFIDGLEPTAPANRVLLTLLVATFSPPGPRESPDYRGQSRSVDARDAVVTNALVRFRGKNLRPGSDGLLATFDGPTRALQCALTLVAAFRTQGVGIRVGVHTGEVVVHGDDVEGAAREGTEHAARIAPEGDVVATGAVKNLVAGSLLGFDRYGENRLPEELGGWPLYRVTDGRP